MSKATRQFDRVALKQEEKKKEAEDAFESLPSIEPPEFALAANPNSPPSDNGDGPPDGGAGADAPDVAPTAETPDAAPSDDANPQSKQQEKESAEKGNKPKEMKADGSARKGARSEITRASRGVLSQMKADPAIQMKSEMPIYHDPAATQAPVQMKKATNFNPGGSGGGGEQGDKNIMSKMGQAMGADFSGVKIHKNSSKATSMGALAYAQGNSVHFAPGQYNPGSRKGQELLGHELAHVVQQRKGKVKPTTAVGGNAVNDDKGLEAEADRMGAKAAAFKPDAPAAKMPSAPKPITPNSPVQRKVDPDEEEKLKQQEAAEKAQEPELTDPAGDGAGDTPPADATGNEDTGNGDPNEKAETQGEGKVESPTGEDLGAKEGEDKKGKEDKKGGKDGEKGDSEKGQQVKQNLQGSPASGAGAAGAKGGGNNAQGPQPLNPGFSGIQNAMSNGGGNANAGRARSLAGNPGKFALPKVDEKGQVIQLKPVDEAKQRTEDHLKQAGDTVQGLNSLMMSRVAGSVDGLSQMTPEIAVKINGAVQASSANIRQTMADQALIIRDNFTTLQTQVTDEAERVRGAIKEKATTRLADILTLRDGKKGEIEQAATTAKGVVDSRLATHKSDLEAKYQEYYDDFVKAGTDAGKGAYDHAKGRHDTYVSQKNGEMGRLIDWYVHDRQCQAQADAALEVGENYQKELEKEGKKQADEAMKGIARDQQAATEIAGMFKDTIDEAATLIIDTLNAQYDAAKGKIETEQTTQTQAVTDEETATITALETDRDDRITLVNSVGEEKIASLEGIGSAAADALTQSINDVTGAMADSISQFNSAVSGMELPDPDKYQGVIDEINGKIEASTAEVREAVLNNSISVVEAVTELGFDVQTVLMQVTEKGNTDAGTIAQSFVDQAVVIEGDAIRNIDQAHTDLTSQAGEILSAATTVYGDINKALDDKFKEDITNLDTSLGESVTSVQDGLNDAWSNGIDAEIDKQAKEAYDKVQPKWKGILKIVLIIVVVIVIAVVLGPAILAAAGAVVGAAGLTGTAATIAAGVLGGAIMGGLGGALIQIGNNAIDGKLELNAGDNGIFNGVGTAVAKGMISGAIGGGFGALSTAATGTFSAIGSGWSKIAFETAMDLGSDMLGDVVAGWIVDGEVPGFRELLTGAIVNFGIGKIADFGISKSQTLTNIQTRSAEFGDSVGTSMGNRMFGNNTPEVDVNGTTTTNNTEGTHTEAEAEGIRTETETEAEYTGTPAGKPRSQEEWAEIQGMSGADQAKKLELGPNGDGVPPEGHFWYKGQDGVPTLRQKPSYEGDRMHYDPNTNTYVTTKPDGSFSPSVKNETETPEGDVTSTPTADPDADYTGPPAGKPRTEEEWATIRDMSGADQAKELGLGPNGNGTPPDGHFWYKGSDGVPTLRKKNSYTGDRQYYDPQTNTYTTTKPDGSFEPTVRTPQTEEVDPVAETETGGNNDATDNGGSGNSEHPRYMDEDGNIKHPHGNYSNIWNPHDANWMPFYNPSGDPEDPQGIQAPTAYDKEPSADDFAPASDYMPDSWSWEQN